MDLGLSGKTVLVTGGTKGLGIAICQVMAEEKANIIFTGRQVGQVQALEEALKRTFGISAFGIVQDLSKADSLDDFFRNALQCTGQIDILVNNAAIWSKAYVAEMKREDFQDTIKLNLEVPFSLCQMTIRNLLQRQSKGKIINVVSQAAFHGSTSGHAHYAASKGGLVSFTVSLAREVAPYGINVNAIAPGIMETSMLTGISEEQRESYKRRIPLGRIADPLEVAYAAAFLASDKSDYLTGITLDATGGMLMR